MVIEATRRSSRLKGASFLILSYKLGRSYPQSPVLRLNALLTELVLQRFMCLSMLPVMIGGKSLSVASDKLDIPSFTRASTSSILFIFLYL